MGRRLLLILIMTWGVLLIACQPYSAKADCTGSVSDCTGSHNQANTSKTNQSQTHNGSTNTVSKHSAVTSYVKLLFALMFVLLLIYLLYRFVSKKTKSFQDYGAIKNIGGVAVGPNRSVQLVRVGKDVLVVGVGENVNLLKEINDPEAITDLLEQPTQSGSQITNIWQQWLEKLRDRTKLGQKTSSFNKILSDKLSTMSETRKNNFELIKKQEDKDE